LFERVSVAQARDCVAVAGFVWLEGLDAEKAPEAQAEAAVDQGEAGEEGLVAFPADTQRAAEAGAEVDTRGRIEHGGTEARRRRGEFTGMHRMNRRVRSVIRAISLHQRR